MKNFGKLSLGMLFLSFFFFGAIFSKPLILDYDESPYVTIFEKETLLGDANFNLIRLYKIATPAKFRRELPQSVMYALSVKYELRDLQKTTLSCPEVLNAHGRIIIDQNNKEYFYKMFSGVVDDYVWADPGFACTSKKGEIPVVWNVPGEIIYFNEDKVPCDVEVGCFQYAIDAHGFCVSRCFIRHLRMRIVTDHRGEAHCFTTNYQHFDRLVIGRLIDEFLTQRQTADDVIFSNSWLKEINSALARYKRVVGESFL